MSDKKSTKKKKEIKFNTNKDGYLYSMSHAASIDQPASLLNMIPIAFFAAIVIIVVRYYTYNRPMSQFFWTSQTDTDTIVDFFSYYKMEMIVISAIIALVMLLFRATTQSFYIKKCYAYIPMLVYALFVILSYIFSDYKEFALWGWNDRFEGTIPLLCYMVMLFLIINSVNAETNIKQIIWPIAISSFVLSILGVTQALDVDFFRTALGEKLLMPNYQLEDGTTIWQQIDAAESAYAQTGQHYLTFTFNDKQIYQTVYNINYVSFYLTLLVPLFTMIFIRLIRDKEAKLWKKIATGVLLSLLIFNLIGSASSGGYMGLGVAVIIALIIFNKQLLKWIKPLLMVIVVLAIVMGCTTDRWLPEISNAVKSALGIGTTVEETADETTTSEAEPGSVAPSIQYVITGTNTITMSVENNEMIVAAMIENNGIAGFNVCDAEGNVLDLLMDEDGIYQIVDDRFNPYVKVCLAYDGSQYFIQIQTGGYPWNFIYSDGEIYFYAETGRTVKLDKIETIGFENNPGFGSGRGSIWAHSFPLLKNSLIIGTGADTFCAVYPQNDYAAKWTENGNSADNLYLIVDKPHNMYLHAAIGTGCISLIALLALWGTYVFQSIKLFWKRDLENDFLLFAGAGTFLGVTAFLVTGLVDDSTVSVMPLFYTMLGMGIATNMIIKRRDAKRAAVE